MEWRHLSISLPNLIGKQGTIIWQMLWQNWKENWKRIRERIYKLSHEPLIKIFPQNPLKDFGQDFGKLICYYSRTRRLAWRLAGSSEDSNFTGSILRNRCRCIFCCFSSGKYNHRTIWLCWRTRKWIRKWISSFSPKWHCSATKGFTWQRYARSTRSWRSNSSRKWSYWQFTTNNRCSWKGN